MDINININIQFDEVEKTELLRTETAEERYKRSISELMLLISEIAEN